MKVLLLGDSCVDEIITGTCDRISPEAPVPVVKVISIQTRAGMAGNVKANLQSFGIDVDFHTNEEQIIKTRIIDDKSGQHMLRIDQEETVEPFNLIPINYKQYDAIVISDYDKGFITSGLVEMLRASYDGPIFIDSKKKDLAKFEGCFVKINELETNNATTLPSKPWLITTVGGSGAKYMGKVYSAPRVTVFDVCGAGDTFLAALTYGYLDTGSIDHAIELANKCAAITVQNRGVYCLSQDDIKNL